MTDDETPSEPTKVSATEAARRIGVSKATMGRYLSKGRVSYERDPNVSGGYLIQLSDLYRAFPEAFKKLNATFDETPPGDDLKLDATLLETAGMSAALRVEVKMLREMLQQANLERDRDRRALSETIDDLRTRLDEEAQERRALSVQLLTYQKDPPAKGGMLRWFRRAG